MGWLLIEIDDIGWCCKNIFMMFVSILCLNSNFDMVTFVTFSPKFTWMMSSSLTVSGIFNCSTNCWKSWLVFFIPFFSFSSKTRTKDSRIFQLLLPLLLLSIFYAPPRKCYFLLNQCICYFLPSLLNHAIMYLYFFIRVCFYQLTESENLVVIIKSYSFRDSPIPSCIES